MNFRTIEPAARTATLIAAGVLALAACGRNNNEATAVPTATVSRRDIVMTTEATGTVEPVDTVAVKSQASGLIIRMPVEVGTYVKPGDLIAQIDTRNLKNDYDRAVAAQAAAQSGLEVNGSARKRADVLFSQGVITAAEHEQAIVAEANAKSSLVAAQTNLRVARQNLEYATLRAEVAGTVISKNASVGTVVSSAVSNVGGGSTIVTVADLSRVRMRALVNETDIAGVHPGQAAHVTVDALPNRQFAGVVEKVEPQATVQQSVTMFPVLVSLLNSDRVLLPGMNGEVSMVIQQKTGVLAIPNDAIRAGRDLTTAGTALGINADSMRAAMPRRGQGGGAGGGGEAGGQGGQRVQGGPAGSGARPGSGGPSAASGGQRGAGPADSGAAGARRGPGGAAGTGMGSGMGAGGGAGMGGMGGGTRGFVFVKKGEGWELRPVRLGITNFDYTEVISGLKQGEQVALLATVLVQQQRDQSSARARSMTGGALPGGGGGGGGGGRSGGGGR